MIVRIVKFVALGAMLAAGSAVQSARAGAGSPAVVVVQQATAEAARKSAEKRFCVRTTITGSRIPRKLCQTRKAWLADGFDPSAPGN